MSITNEKEVFKIDLFDMLIILFLLFLLFASHMVDLSKNKIDKPVDLKKEEKHNIILEQNNNLVEENDSIDNVSNDKPYK
tara:strand:+ start:269 stop:508 length:240 start_codon:yes stop_codon:yes gene_type:complete